MLIVRSWWHQLSCLLITVGTPVCATLWCHKGFSSNIMMSFIQSNATISLGNQNYSWILMSALHMCSLNILQGCQPVQNFRILYRFYMQNTGVRIWPSKYGNWALSVLSLKVLLPEQTYLFWVANQSRFVVFYALKPSNTSLITKTFILLSSTCSSNTCSSALPVPVVPKESTRVFTGSQWVPPE